MTDKEIIKQYHLIIEELLAVVTEHIYNQHLNKLPIMHCYESGKEFLSILEEFKRYVNESDNICKSLPILSFIDKEISDIKEEIDFTEKTTLEKFGFIASTMSQISMLEKERSEIKLKINEKWEEYIVSVLNNEHKENRQ